MKYTCTRNDLIANGMRTIKRDLKPGDVIVVPAGVYDFPMRLRDDSAGIALVGQPGAVFAQGVQLSGENITVQGIESRGTILVNKPGCRILDNYIHDTVGSGVMAAFNGGIDVRGNVIGWCGATPLDHGVYLGGKGKKVIEDNVIFESGGFNVHVYSERADISGIDIKRNVMFAPFGGNLVVGAGPDARPAYMVDDVAIENNFCLNPIGTRKPLVGLNIGFWAKGGKNITAKNNVIVGAEYGVWVRSVSCEVSGNQAKRVCVGDSVTEQDNVPTSIIGSIGSGSRRFVYAFNKDRTLGPGWSKLSDGELATMAKNTVGLSTKMQVADTWKLHVTPDLVPAGAVSIRNVLDMEDRNYSGKFQAVEVGADGVDIVAHWDDYLPEFACFLVESK